MNNIIILYPELFNCYTKFSRKISKIIQNFSIYSITYQNDSNGFIADYFKDKIPADNIINNKRWDVSKVTHGIIFDDGEEFSEETNLLKTNNINLRIINIDITRVINIKNETEYKSQKSSSVYEYIGRGSYWGNPHSMYEKGDDRDEVIRKYKYDFDYEKFPNKEKSKVYKLAGKRLGCFCKPLNCHGDILADFLNSWDDDK